MIDLHRLGIIGGFVFGGCRTGFVRPVARVLMDTTVPLALAVLGPLLPQDTDAVVELLP